MNYLIYDLGIAALLLFFLWRGYRKGFILTLCGLLAVFVAFVGAAVISDALAEPMSALIRPMVEDWVLEILNERVASDPSIPATEFSLLSVLGVLGSIPFFSGLTEMFREALESGTAEVAGSAALALAEYASLQLARVLLFLVAFVAVLLLWWFISHALDLAFRLPVLSTLNRWSGALLGLAEAVLLVYAACWLLADRFLPPEAVEQTYLLNFFCTTTLSDLIS